MTKRQRESKTTIDNALTFLIVGVLFMWGAYLVMTLINN
jgi:hypothetical protein